LSLIATVLVALLLEEIHARKIEDLFSVLFPFQFLVPIIVVHSHVFIVFGRLLIMGMPTVWMGMSTLLLRGSLTMDDCLGGNWGIIVLVNE